MFNVFLYLFIITCVFLFFISLAIRLSLRRRLLLTLNAIRGQQINSQNQLHDGFQNHQLFNSPFTVTMNAADSVSRVFFRIIRSRLAPILDQNTTQTNQQEPVEAANSNLNASSINGTGNLQDTVQQYNIGSIQSNIDMNTLNTVIGDPMVANRIRSIPLTPSNDESETTNSEPTHQNNSSATDQTATLSDGLEDNSPTSRQRLNLTMNLTFNIHHNNRPDGLITQIMANAFGGGMGAEFDPNLMHTRHRIYSVLLVRAALLYSLSVPKFLRNFFEYSILSAGIFCFMLLIHLHWIFIRSPLTCLDHVKHTWPRDGIVRVQIGNHQQHSELTIMNDLKESKYSSWYYPPIEMSNKTNTTIQFPLTYQQYHQMLVNRTHLDVINDLIAFTDDSQQETYSILIDPSFLSMGMTLKFFNNSKNSASVWSEPYVVEYSLEYGLLRLSEEMRLRYHVPVMKVTLDPEVDSCFGNAFARSILRNFLGYDDVLIGSIKQLAELENNRGFVRNVITGEHFRFVNVWMTRTSYLAAAFIMIIFTLFVSMLIRYSHQQVFVFVSEFLRSLELQQAASRISFLSASLVTVILALIGMETIMYEFFADSSITFHVIIMVWAADQFDSMAIRSPISKRHFLRFFYLYQFVFYAYHYRFNGQYSGLALLTTMLFTYHSMIFFFHHFELPLLRATYTINGHHPPLGQSQQNATNGHNEEPSTRASSSHQSGNSTSENDQEPRPSRFNQTEQLVS